MDNQIVIDWAEGIKTFLLDRQTEMNGIEINDGVLQHLRARLEREGYALFATLNEVQHYINSR